MGFGKSFIFQLFLKIQEMTGEMCCALVITTLESGINVQIKHTEGLRLTATSSTAQYKDGSPASFRIGRRCTGQGFLKVLEGHPNNFHKRMPAILVDESHTVETWTGKR